MTTIELDDAAAVRRSLASPAAFAVVYDRHAPAVHRYLSRRAGEQTADDLLGEVFVVALSARHRYDPACGDAGPWLYGIARNVLLNELRRRSRERGAVERQARRAEAAVDPWQELDAQLDAAAAAPAVRLALRSLPPQERELLLLVAWEELTPTQAALALDIPAGTARSRLHRARTQLRDALAGSAPARAGAPAPTCEETR